MTRRRMALAALLLIVPVWLAAAPAFAEQPVRSGNAVFDRAVALVNEHFYDQAKLPAFNEAAALAVTQMPSLAAGDPTLTGEAIAFVLDSLGVSHTGRFTADQVDYYELADVFRYGLRRDLRRVFPSGDVTYDGIGIVSRRSDGLTFVSDVYDGSPAAAAGILPGDEIVSVDGEPFSEIGSFAGKAGETAQVAVRHSADDEPLVLDVAVKRIEPGDLFLEAISASVRRLDQNGLRIGYIRIWAYTRNEVTRILYDELGSGRLKDVDGLVLDLRSKWGGAPGDAADTFIAPTASMEMVDRDGGRSFQVFRWDKPVVAIIDEGTRSGMEVLAHSLQKNGIPLVGSPSAGNVVAGTAYLLPDDSLLEVAVADVFVDGKRLEGNPVEPDFAVPFDVRYANGNDPQLDAATSLMAQRLSEGGGVN